MQAVQIIVSLRHTVKMPKQYNHHASLRKKMCLWKTGFLEGKEEDDEYVLF